MEQELLEQAEQAMEKARGAGADDVVVQVQDAQKTEYAFRDGKLEQVQQELQKVTEDGDLGSAPILVFGNKIDIEGHMKEEELFEKLKLNDIIEAKVRDIAF